MKQYPLSRSQERLWFEDRFEPGMATYNDPYCFHLVGPLSIAALQESLRTVIDRHEILRSIFREVDDQLVQVVQDYNPETFSFIDCSALPEGERSNRALQAAMQEARTPFDLCAGPLVRAKVQRMTASEHILSFTFHHAVTDGWSATVFFKEFSEIYQAHSTGRKPSLSAVPIQYGEYARKERESTQDASMARSIAYWQEHLGGTLSPLDLPTDRARPAVRRSAGARFFSSIDPVLLEKLRSVSSKNEVTLFTLLLAAFNTLLYRYTGQEDILVGTPVARRRVLELFNSIGFFANTIVLRTSLEGNPTFLDLLKRVRDDTWDTLEYQDFAFEELVRVLQVQRDLSRTPLYQVMFVQDPTGEWLELSGVTIRRLNVENGGAKCDLTLVIRESGDGAQADFEYSTDLFDEATILRMVSHYTRLLEGIASNPICRLTELPILTEGERNQLLRETRNAETDRPTLTCIHRLFEEQVERCGTAVSLVCGNDQLTYDALNVRANRLAHHLRAKGVAGDVLVGLCMERSVDMVVGIIGILKAGGAYVPLDPRYPDERLRFIVGDTQPKVVVAQRQTVPMLADLGIPIVCVDEGDGELPNESIANPECNVSPENLAYVIYTSGSSGQPKGVAIEHRSVVNFLFSMKAEPGLESNDVLMSITAPSFDISGLEFFLPLMSGARIVMAGESEVQDGRALIALMRRSSLTVMQATPSTWQILLTAGWAGDPKLKILSGGEPLTQELAHALLERGSSLWNLYGPTETTIYSSVSRITGHEDRITIGRPIANTQFFILGDNLQLMPKGIPGELYIGGDGLARGYWNRPELTAQRFVAATFDGGPSVHLYRTGDRAKYLRDGQIGYLGRLDDQVKIRGHRIEPAEIEFALKRHAKVRDAIVVARTDSSGETKLIGYIISEDDPPKTSGELRNFLQKTLPGHLIPAAIIFVREFPLTPNGKLDRSALPKPVQDIGDRGEVYEPPRNSVERRIAAVWSEILQIERIGTFDNFFELGGHSLSAMRAVVRLSQEFGIEVPIRALFEHPSVGALAEAITQSIQPGSPEQY